MPIKYFEAELDFVNIIVLHNMEHLCTQIVLRRCSNVKRKIYFAGFSRNYVTIKE